MNITTPEGCTKLRRGLDVLHQTVTQKCLQVYFVTAAEYLDGLTDIARRVNQNHHRFPDGEFEVTLGHLRSIEKTLRKKFGGNFTVFDRALDLLRNEVG